MGNGQRFGNLERMQGEEGGGLGIWKVFSDRGSELAQSQVVAVSPRHPPTYQLRTRPV